MATKATPVQSMVFLFSGVILNPPRSNAHLLGRPRLILLVSKWVDQLRWYIWTSASTWWGVVPRCRPPTCEPERALAVLWIARATRVACSVRFHWRTTQSGRMARERIGDRRQQRGAWIGPTFSEKVTGQSRHAAFPERNMNVIARRPRSPRSWPTMATRHLRPGRRVGTLG